MAAALSFGSRTDKRVQSCWITFIINTVNGRSLQKSDPLPVLQLSNSTCPGERLDNNKWRHADGSEWKSCAGDQLGVLLRCETSAPQSNLSPDSGPVVRLSGPENEYSCPPIDQLAPATSASDSDEFIVSQGGIATEDNSRPGFDRCANPIVGASRVICSAGLAPGGRTTSYHSWSKSEL